MGVEGGGTPEVGVEGEGTPEVRSPRGRVDGTDPVEMGPDPFEGCISGAFCIEYSQ